MHEFEVLIGKTVKMPQHIAERDLRMWQYRKNRAEKKGEDFTESEPEISYPKNNEELPTPEELLAEFGFEDYQIRVWWPGSAGTMDYVPTRLNLQVDENGKIYKVDLG